MAHDSPLPPRSFPSGDLASAIYEIGLAAGLAGRLDEVIRRIVKEVLRATGSQFAGVALVQPGQGVVAHRWGITADAVEYDECRQLPLGRGVVGRVAATGRTIVVEDVTALDDYDPMVAGTRSELAVPLCLGGEVLGVLDVESDSLGHFDPGRVRLLESVASPIARSIEAARLFHETTRRLDELGLLSHVSRIITSTVDLEELLQVTVRAIRARLGTHMVALGLVDEASNRVVLRAADAAGPLAVPIGFSLPIGEGVTGRVVRSGRSVLVTDVAAEPGYVRVADAVRSEICSPLRSRRGVIGFLDASSTRVGGFDPHDLLLLDTLAEHIAQAIDNARTLQQLDQVREELSAVVVHDLRNPLTVVMSALDMLAQLEHRRAAGHGPSPERITSTMQRLHQEARAACEEMLVLTAGLVDLHKLDAGKVVLATEPCSVGDLVRAVAERLGVVAEARHVGLAAQVEETLPTVELDVGLMSRMLESLVLHSIKLTPEGGHVCLDVSTARPESLRAHSIERPTGVVLRVTDTGPGIPPEARERLFDKYAVVESRRMRQGRGTGLGLAFCRRVAQLHGGAIRVDDNAPSGNVFSVLLPV